MVFSYLAHKSNGLEAVAAVESRRQEDRSAWLENVKNRSGTQPCFPKDKKTLEKDSFEYSFPAKNAFCFACLTSSSFTCPIQ